jgi:glycyl-tRNA synthetase
MGRARREKRQAEDEARAAAKEFCEKLFRGNYVPHVIEPSAGLDRLALAVLARRITRRTRRT